MLIKDNATGQLNDVNHSEEKRAAASNHARFFMSGLGLNRAKFDMRDIGVARAYSTSEYSPKLFLEVKAKAQIAMAMLNSNDNSTIILHSNANA